MALNNLAWVAGQLKDPKALEYAERADKLAPGNPAILDTYGMLLVEKGDIARGVEMLQKAIAIAPNARRDSPQSRSRVDQGRAEGRREEGTAIPLAKLGGQVLLRQAESRKAAMQMRHCELAGARGRLVCPCSRRHDPSVRASAPGA